MATNEKPSARRLGKERIRAYLIANMFDGCDEGMHTAPTKAWVDEASDLIEQLVEENAAPQDTDPTASERWAGTSQRFLAPPITVSNAAANSIPPRPEFDVPELLRALREWEIAIPGNPDSAMCCKLKESDASALHWIVEQWAARSHAREPVIAHPDKDGPYICCADGEGSHEFRICADKEAVFKFYEDMTGRDQDGTLTSLESAWSDPDEWRNEGTALEIELYMARFYVWKVSAGELASPPLVAHHLGDGERRTWIEVRRPKLVPNIKAPLPGKASDMLRELYALYPEAQCTVIELRYGPEIWLTDGKEWMEVEEAFTRPNTRRGEA